MDKPAHNSITQARIDAAREHYLTRADRRPKGQFAKGVFDETLYGGIGSWGFGRRDPSFSLYLRQELVLLSGWNK